LSYVTAEACNCLVPYMEGVGNHSPSCKCVRCPACGADVRNVVLHECPEPGEVVVNPDGLPLL
jgi:hypothetical protein